MATDFGDDVGETLLQLLRRGAENLAHKRFRDLTQQAPYNMEQILQKMQGGNSQDKILMTEMENAEQAQAVSSLLRRNGILSISENIGGTNYVMYPEIAYDRIFGLIDEHKWELPPLDARSHDLKPMQQYSVDISQDLTRLRETALTQEQLARQLQKQGYTIGKANDGAMTIHHPDAQWLPFRLDKTLEKNHLEQYPASDKTFEKMWKEVDRADDIRGQVRGQNPIAEKGKRESLSDLQKEMNDSAPARNMRNGAKKQEIEMQPER